jgi:3-oxoadipate enol-lactonase
VAYVDANGIRLYVDESGDGPPLLLIMGLGATHETWFAQREAFAAAHRVIAFDNRGAGRSDSPPGPWSVPDMAADALGVLDALGITRADVVGVSMGGMIAQEMAIRYPARVDRMVVAMSFARPDPIRRAFLLHRRWARLQGADSLQESIANLPWLLSASSLADGARLGDIIESFASLPFVSAQAYANQVDAILDHETLSRLPTVRAPTLVLAAAEDVLTPVFLSAEIAAAIPGARLHVLPRGNHAVQVEYADAFNAAILEWLRQTPARQEPAKEDPDSLHGDAPPRR